jgi:glutaredoxin
MFKKVLKILFLIVFSINIYASGVCAIDDPTNCDDVEKGFLTTEEVKNISKKDSFSYDIYKKIHEGKVYIYLFYSYDCPHCKEAYTYLESFEKKHSDVVFLHFEIKKNKVNAKFFEKISKTYNMTPTGVPTIFIGDKFFTGFHEPTTCSSILKEYKVLKGEDEDCGCAHLEIDVPMFGTINVKTISLPSFTIYIGLLDGLNPCAMWVLVFLLGLLVNAKNRKKMILIGSIFVISSGLIYYIFMLAWFNVFFIIGYSSLITIILGSVAILMGLVNIKELFFFKKGFSLMIPESVKPKLYKKARDIINEENNVFAILGTIALAVFVNFIELGCTVGLPAIYTRILSVKGVSSLSSYMYIALYNLMYIVPLIIIVSLFVYTMGRFKFREHHGKILKLISGILMLLLGLMLIFSPEALILT